MRHVDAGATSVESSDPEPPPSDEPNTETDVAVEPVDEAAIDPVGDETTADPVVTTVDEPDESRALLIAAVVSAASILVGGLWFERRRKAWEAKSTTASEPAPTSDPLAIDPPPVPSDAGIGPGPSAPLAHGHDSVLDDSTEEFDVS